MNDKPLQDLHNTLNDVFFCDRCNLELYCKDHAPIKIAKACIEILNNLDLDGNRVKHSIRTGKTMDGLLSRARSQGAQFSNANTVKLIVSAYLHDVGYSVIANNPSNPYQHSIAGANFLREYHFPRLIAALVAYHSTAPEEAALSGTLDVLHYYPEPPVYEQYLLWRSDFTSSSTGLPVTFEERIAEIRSRYDSESVTVRSLDASYPRMTMFSLPDQIEMRESYTRSRAGLRSLV